MKKIVNSICVVFGFLSLILGVIGIVLPILPTTPFFILATICFAKGSEKFHHWFLETTIYKKYIERTIQKKEMTKKAKFSTLATISVFLLIGFLFSPVWYAKCILVLIAVAHYYYFLFRIKTVRETDIEETQLGNRAEEDIPNGSE